MPYWFLNRFSRKLTAAFCLTVLIAMGFTAFLITRASRTFLIRDLTEDLATQANLIANQLNSLNLGEKNRQKTQSKVIELAGVSNCRITLIAPDGEVFSDSSVPLEKLSTLENHKDRPEVRDALSTASGTSIRHSHTINQDLLYVAIPWKNSGKLTGVVRLAIQLDRVKKKIDLLNRTIRWITLGMMALAILIALTISKSISAPIVDISEVIHKLAEGSYGVRVRHVPSEHSLLASAVNQLADKIQFTIEELARDKSQLSTTLSNMVESVVVVNSSGKIVVMNPALAQLFQIDMRSSYGKPFLEVLRHNQLNQLLESVLKDRTARIDEVRTFTPTERVFEAHGVPLTQDGHPSGVLLVLHDISRLRQLEQIRKEFVANVSHELRTPLASMKGFAETLRLGAIDDKAHRMEFVQSIEKHAEQMTQLVDDLLDLAAIESGKRVPQRIPLGLSELAQQVIKNIQPLADRKKIQIKLREAPGLPPVLGDSAQVKQVFINLLDNAIKFNKEGGQVEILFLTENNFIRTSVKDSGMGIPSDDLPRVFERFFRVDKARSRDMGGTGLGLAIVKHIIETHGGSVSVQSVEGEGSTFSFSLPLI